MKRTLKELFKNLKKNFKRTCEELDNNLEITADLHNYFTTTRIELTDNL